MKTKGKQGIKCSERKNIPEQKSLAGIPFEIKNPALAPKGKQRIQWSGQEMLVMRQIQERFAIEKPLAGIRLIPSYSVTTETAHLVIALKNGGADLILIACYPMSTQDDVAASLVVNYGIPVFAMNEIEKALEHRLQL